MSSYQKFTLGTFKKKLANGDYENATGANRAIGKTQELSEGDKVKAKSLVAAHFGTEVAKSKPAKKVAKKAKKAVAKAPAKKTVVKKAKKVAKAVKTAPAAKPAKKTAKRAKKAAKRSKSSAAAVEAEPAISTEVAPPARAKALKVSPLVLPPVAGTSDDRTSTIKMMGDIITYVDVVLKSMELSKKLFPKGDIDNSVRNAQSIMTKAVSVLDGVVSPMSTEGDAQVATAAKSVAKKGKSKPKPITAVATPAVDTVEPVADDSNLTEDEREEIRIARKHQPAIDRKHGNPTATA
jgi:hypothetical protein